jgi:ribosomal protein S8
MLRRKLSRLPGTVRLWAEREAERAFGHGKILEQFRKRWANQGIEVSVDRDLDEDNVPGPSWFYSGSATELNKFLRRVPLHNNTVRGENLKSRIANAMVESRQATERTLSGLKHQIQGILDEIQRRKEHLWQKSISSEGQRVQDTRSSTDQVTQGLPTGIVEHSKGFADNNRWEANKLP